MTVCVCCGGRKLITDVKVLIKENEGIWSLGNNLAPLPGDLVSIATCPLICFCKHA